MLKFRIRDHSLIAVVAIQLTLGAGCCDIGANKRLPSAAVLVKTINDSPSTAHSDSTPSVTKLIELGDDAIMPTLPLLLSSDQFTRMRAQRVLEGVTIKRYGFRFGLGWSNTQGEEKWREFWRSLGSLDWQAPEDKRARSIELWVDWLVKQDESVN